MLPKLPFRIISSFLCLSGQSSCCRCSYFPSPSFLMQTLSLFLKIQNTLSQAYNKRLSSRFIAFFTCATPYSTVMTILRFQAWVTCGLRKSQRKLGTNEWSFSSPSLPVAIDKLFAYSFFFARPTDRQETERWELNILYWDGHERF